MNFYKEIAFVIPDGFLAHPALSEKESTLKRRKKNVFL